MHEDIKILEAGFIDQLLKYLNQKIDGNPLWSSQFIRSHPEEIIQAHLDVLRGGAELYHTNTYQLNVNEVMKHLGLTEKESREYIKDAVNLAKEARARYLKENQNVTRKPLILGCCGPYGTSLRDFSEYTGAYADKVSKKELMDWHRPRVQTFMEAGVDLLTFDTCPALAEAEAVIELLKEFPDMKAWISFSATNEHGISHGEKFADAARKCWDSSTQLVGIGVNCMSPYLVTPLIKDANVGRENNPIPLIIYPNIGEKYDEDKGMWVDKDKAVPIASFAKEWLDLGARYIGGCCRSHVEDMQQIKAEVEKWKLARRKS